MNPFSQVQMDQLIEWICKIQQIPGATFHEEARAAYMVSEFQRLGISDIHLDESGNVLARWPGESSLPVIISAHLDTVHLRSDLPLEHASTSLTGPGVADNATGLAGLLALADWLASEKVNPPGDIWLVADVCEEGLGNLAGMRAVVDKFKGQVKAYLVLEGLGIGQICHRGLGVLRFRITAETAGGHSWVDYGSLSAIHELARVMADLAELTIPRNPRSSLNIGIIRGGTSINTIAPSAYLEIDLRSENQEVLLRLKDRVYRLVRAHEKPGVKYTIDAIGDRPAGDIPASHPLVTCAVNVTTKLGYQPKLEIGSTDANIPLSLGYPAVCIGLSRGSHPHTIQETVEIEPLGPGMDQLRMLIDEIWRLPE